MNRQLTWLMLAATCLSATAAEAPSQAVNKVIDCSKMQDSLQRLTCYDREAAALSKSVTAAPAAAAAAATPQLSPSPSSRAGAAAEPVAKAKSPGLLARAKSAVGSVFSSSATEAPELAAAPVKAAASAPAAFGAEQIVQKPSELKKGQSLELKATIATLRETMPETWLFTLDNGQVWRQDEVRVGFQPEQGEEVTLRKGALGSYRLNLDRDGSKAWVRVTRMR